MMEILSSSDLILGAGIIDRKVTDAGALLCRYRGDTGCYYLDYVPATSADELVPEDIAVTLLVNSQVTGRAFRSIQLRAGEINLQSLPNKHLQDTTLQERQTVAEIIAVLATFEGFAASVATKLLHKKRPGLIPILDNQAIFGAYLNPKWPTQQATGYSVKGAKWILEALNRITTDLNRPENQMVWPVLEAIEPTRTRIQLFDSVWWIYFRATQPVQRR